MLYFQSQTSQNHPNETVCKTYERPLSGGQIEPQTMYNSSFLLPHIEYGHGRL